MRLARDKGFRIEEVHHLKLTKLWHDTAYGPVLIKVYPWVSYGMQGAYQQAHADKRKVELNESAA